MRARIIAPSWDGLGVAGIAAEPGCHAKTVRWWLHRFNMLGVEGLEDRPVAGRPRRITEAELSRIIGLAKQDPQGRLTRREEGELAAEDESGAPGALTNCNPTWFRRSRAGHGGEYENRPGAGGL
ncbi:helix-turn-helix domain-containing protein [Streptomyces sp. NPDC057575]|uniref:helix-turn-helix domain-containing protein n=1 Tax=Streptomyces sp. NPDC057575 TaxID=3346170 RepID=UPI0036AE1C48